MERITIRNRLQWAALCPVPKCSHKQFVGDTNEGVLEQIRDHLKANFQDPNHSEIADMEGWFDKDPLGD